jgi:transaldolase
MTNNPLKSLGALGQSLWLDYIRRDLVEGDGLRRLIEDDGLRGMTSNPAIFEKAIAQSHEYDTEIRTLARLGATPMAIYDSLSLRDVRTAAAEFKPLYDLTEGGDGFVSLEVSPHLAHDSRGTIDEGRRLWKALGKPNALIKVPATDEGLVAIRELIGDGISVNVTLIFGLSRYRQVIDAYLSGLEDRASRGEPLQRVASVASFFVSRIDSMVDTMLDGIAAANGPTADIARSLRGEVAIASAKMAYQLQKKTCAGERFGKLLAKGAGIQRLLWASTGTKDPAFSDVKYVEALIGPDTVDTAPPETIDAFRDHGKPAQRLELDLERTSDLLARLTEIGIDLDLVAHRLEDEGVEKFKQPFDKLLASIAAKASAPATTPP